jgi:hypothetical protein
MLFGVGRTPGEENTHTSLKTHTVINIHTLRKYTYFLAELVWSSSSAILASSSWILSWYLFSLFSVMFFLWDRERDIRRRRRSKGGREER